MTDNQEPENSSLAGPAVPLRPGAASEGPPPAGRSSVTEELAVGDQGSAPASRWRPIGVAAAVVGLVSGGVLVTAFAASGSDSPPASASPSASPSASAGSGQADGHHGGRGPLAGLGRAGLGPPLHGELVVPKKDGGGNQTVVVQAGTVTAVSGTSVAVRSTDGFAATYVVTSQTRVGRDGAKITSIKTGASVRIAATKDGSTLTALMVGDAKDRPDDGQPGGHRPGDGQPGDGQPGDGQPGDGQPGDGQPGGDGQPTSPAPTGSEQPGT
jgi:hypothetical protein